MLRFFQPLVLGWFLASMLFATDLRAAIFSDNFEESAHAGSNRLALDAGFQFFLAHAGSTAGTATIEQDAVFGSRALVVRPAAGTSSPIVGLLPINAFLAQNGDSLKLDFKFRFLNPSTDNANAANFRLGIHYSRGTTNTADGQTTGSNPITDNDYGYIAAFGNLAQPSTTLLYREFGNAPNNSPILGGSDRVAMGASGGMRAITDTDVHRVSFVLTRLTLNSLGVSLTVDDDPAITATETSVLYTQLNQISFSSGFVTPSMQYALDDIQITANNFSLNAVPEASVVYSVAALCLGCFAAKVNRKRHSPLR